jgi:hypothetical protein
MSMETALSYIQAVRVGRTPRPSRTYEVHRVCAVPECKTRLSIYNPERFCWPHTPLTPWPEANRRQPKEAA